MVDPRFYSDLGPLPLGDLIKGLAVILPDPKFFDEPIKSVAKLHGSRTGDITFIADRKALAQLEDASATACFVPEGLANDVAARHILPLSSKYPKAHLSRVTNRLHMPKIHGEAPVIDKTAQIHPSAVIGFGAVIARDVVIGPHAVIGVGVHIGAGTIVEAGAKVSFAALGPECYIKADAVIGGRGFGVSGDEGGLVDIAHIGRVIIGARVSVGSGTCIDRGQLGDTVLGDDVKLDNLVQIGHNVHLGSRTLIAAQTGISGSCVIGADVIIGGAVGIADHLTIGNRAQITARSGVMHNIPAGERWGGVPAMPMRDFLKTIAATRKLIKPKNTDKA